MAHATAFDRAKYGVEYRKKNRGKLRAYMAAYNKTPRHRWTNHTAYAKRHGIEFTLSFDEYLALEGRGCHYCGGERPATGIGLDRIDNARGYSADNVLPCCAFCNLARNDNLTVAEMEREIGPAMRRIREARALANAVAS